MTNEVKYRPLDVQAGACRENFQPVGGKGPWETIVQKSQWEKINACQNSIVQVK